MEPWPATDAWRELGRMPRANKYDDLSRWFLEKIFRGKNVVFEGFLCDHEYWVHDSNVQPFSSDLALTTMSEFSLR